MRQLRTLSEVMIALGGGNAIKDSSGKDFRVSGDKLLSAVRGEWEYADLYSIVLPCTIEKDVVVRCVPLEITNKKIEITIPRRMTKE